VILPLVLRRIRGQPPRRARISPDGRARREERVGTSGLRLGLMMSNITRGTTFILLRASLRLFRFVAGDFADDFLRLT
jgi:hypothetical protein